MAPYRAHVTPGSTPARRVLVLDRNLKTADCAGNDVIEATLTDTGGTATGVFARITAPRTP
ncbi:MAG: hypothetical protein NTW21_22555 [Verrucomicrobia bacterium]|nr:hypothetical protein [Verrucomicrobiota bacterium]